MISSIDQSGIDDILYPSEREMDMTQFNATIEFLSGQKAAIITLTQNGEWSGSCRITTKFHSRSDLYELGYKTASQNAALKGGSLNTYRALS
jgi:hypothetical protein